MRKILFLFFILCYTTISANSTKYSFYGEVRDKKDKSPILGAIVSLPALHIRQQTDENGHFHFDNIECNQCELVISILGYNTYNQTIEITKNRHLVIYLEPESVSLNEITVVSSKNNESTLNTQVANKSFIFDNNSTNLVKTLSKLSGFSSMDIGSGFSKPMIRGLAFNRIAVVDKGITQQDQQWGADHGLGVDQYDVDEVVVHKGPMSLQFGSDAMGGAVEILPVRIPNEDIYYGDAIFIGKSNNDLLGISLMNAVRKKKWFFKARYTYQRYGDYKVPATEFSYLGWILPIYDHRLKNTAGKEQNVSGLISYSDKNIETSLNVSNVYQKNGFFPGAHGIPNANALLNDGSFRNIGMPNNSVNHFKVINNTTLRFSDNLKWITDLGFQYNHRQEFSYFHTHYDNQKAPEKDPNLELDFRLYTTSLGSKIILNELNRWNQTIGIQSELQQNRVGGYSYLLPRFDQISVGGYWLNNFIVNDKLTLSGGIRYDRAHLDIKGFFDETLHKYLLGKGYSETESAESAQRSFDAKPTYQNVSASVGAVYRLRNNQTFKLNIGKSFRFPTANELASNGVHHGAFRHEQGDPDLKQEQGYQIDLDYTLDKDVFSITLSPYASYFTNYIFLAPTGMWSVLPHAGQIYKFKQAKAVFVGGEFQLHAAVYHHFDLFINGQYVYNRNETDKLPLPFTPPFSMRNEIVYSNKYKSIKSYKFSVEHQLYANQDRVARNESETKGANIFNISSNANFLINNFRFTLGLQVQNIFNTNYMNHLSFYRKINLPESGRNFQLLLKIPFYN